MPGHELAPGSLHCVQIETGNVEVSVKACRDSVVRKRRTALLRGRVVLVGAHGGAGRLEDDGSARRARGNGAHGRRLESRVYAGIDVSQ